MRDRSIRLLAVCWLALAGAACGDDSDDAAVVAEEAQSTDVTDPSEPTQADQPADQVDPCTLLDPDDFAAALDVSVEPPEDVSERFPLGDTERFDVDSSACQWMATTAEPPTSVFSVELRTAVGPGADGVFAAEQETIEFFADSDDDTRPLDLPADEALGIASDASPELLVRRGDVVFDLTTASEDLAIDDLVPLAEAVLERVSAE